MRLGHVLSVLAVAAGLALAAAPVQAQLSAENLLTNLPEGFEIGFQTRQGTMDMMEFVPRGETVENWSTMVTVQILHDADDADPGAFARNLGQNWQGACQGSSVSKLDAGETNGFAFALWHYACPLNPGTGKPEAMWLKAIAGADALYVVQYAYRAASTKELEQPALAYLAKASACDTRRADRPCPAGM